MYGYFTCTLLPECPVPVEARRGQIPWNCCYVCHVDAENWTWRVLEAPFPVPRSTVALLWPRPVLHMHDALSISVSTVKSFISLGVHMLQVWFQLLLIAVALALWCWRCHLVGSQVRCWELWMCSAGREKANVAGYIQTLLFLSGDFDVCYGDFSVVTSMVVTLWPA